MEPENIDLEVFLDEVAKVPRADLKAAMALLADEEAKVSGGQSKVFAAFSELMDAAAELLDFRAQLEGDDRGHE